MAKKNTEKALSEMDLKAKSMGAVHAIKIEDGARTLCLYLKQPHRDIVGLYYGKKADNPIKAAEILLKASCLHDISDKEILENDLYFYSAYIQVDEYLNVIKLKKSQSVSL